MPGTLYLYPSSLSPLLILKIRILISRLSTRLGRNRLAGHSRNRRARDRGDRLAESVEGDGTIKLILLGLVGGLVGNGLAGHRGNGLAGNLGNGVAKGVGSELELESVLGLRLGLVAGHGGDGLAGNRGNGLAEGGGGGDVEDHFDGLVSVGW